MARHTHRAGVIGQGTLNALADPPRGVGAELVAQTMFELVDRPHQAAIAFLNQIGERQSRPR